MDLELLSRLHNDRDSKAVLLVLDGLGGLPGHGSGKTELEVADTPNLDHLARSGVTGLHVPVAPGVTPGSGPAHLGLFGYDPLTYQVGRGVLSALGIDYDLKPDHVAARGNFCTVDDDGRVTDRRAGRIPSEEGEELCKKIDGIEIDGVTCDVRPVREYRFLLVLRGRDDLHGDIADTDPQATGVEALKPKARSKASEETSRIAQKFVEAAAERLADEKSANMLLLRGFSQKPDWPTLTDTYGIRAASIASYPMYRGVGKLVGMKAHAVKNEPAAEIKLLSELWDDYDFFFVHIKKTDSYGEDGDFNAKAKLIEKVDTVIPNLMKLQPDALAITGDHSTPAAMKMHSWHPVPLLLWSEVCRPDRVESFGERPCESGSLGANMPAIDIMPILMANAGRLEKFGA